MRLALRTLMRLNEAAMSEPVIHFKDMDASAAVEAKVRENIDRLTRTHARITAVRVTIEGHNHHRRGTPYRVCVDVTVPGAELVVGHSPKARVENEDVYVAVRDAFKATRTALLELRQRMRWE